MPLVRFRRPAMSCLVAVLLLATSAPAAPAAPAAEEKAAAPGRYDGLE